MTETEKKLASNASLLTGVSMLLAMPLWFEIIVVSEQILMLPWMVMSFALIVIIYYSKKLIEDSNPPKWTDLFYYLALIGAWFAAVEAASGGAFATEYNTGLLDVVWFYCIFKYGKEKLPSWGRVGFGIFAVMCLLDGGAFALGTSIPEPLDIGWVPAMLLITFGSWQAYKNL